MIFLFSKKYSDQELLEIFPEAKTIIPEKISEWQEEYDKLANEIKGFLTAVYERCPEKDVWFWEIVAEKLMIPDLLKIENHILRLKRQQIIAKGKSNRRQENYEKFQEKIILARSYPIYELARDKLDLKPSGKNFVALCPFHNEKTPSCYFYTETNTFVCFGCGEKSDIIKFTMHFYGVGFRDAVEMLQAR
ncbi:MAG: tryptophan 7-halogenase [Candidatus Moraniibacteriota bacterium]|nr:MAG: tryptophan 7-halogenase [Candidatus Moranbacteria bacterium]